MAGTKVFAQFQSPFFHIMDHGQELFPLFRITEPFGQDMFSPDDFRCFTQDAAATQGNQFIRNIPNGRIGGQATGRIGPAAFHAQD